MKKLRPEFVAAMAQTIELSAPDRDLPFETIKECCEQGIKRLESAANDPKNGNAQSVLIFVDYDQNGKLGMAFFNARIKEDFFDESTVAGDVPAPVRAAEASKEERIRALRLSISDYLSKIETLAQLSKNGNPLFEIDKIARFALAAQTETKELAAIDPSLEEEVRKFREIWNKS